MSTKLRRRVVALGLVVLLGSWAGAQDARPPSPPFDETEVTSLREELRTATNEARARFGLAPLSADDGLTRAAQAHADENAERGVLDHGSPDPRHDEPIERVGLAGVALMEIGENLAFEPRADVASSVVEGWLGSPPHRANLLESTFTHVGFGVARGDGGLYVAQLLAVRRLDRDAVSARPETREVRSWTLSMHAPVGTDAMVFFAGTPVARVVFDGPTAQLTVNASDAAGEAILGVADAPGRYSVSDRIRLEPDGSWGRDAAAPAGDAAILAAAYDRSLEEGVMISLVYRNPDAPLQLLVDGRHQPGVQPEAGELRAWLPHSDEPRTVSVGLLLADDSIRLLERFTLVVEPELALLPGTPALPTVTPSGDAAR